MRRPGSSTERAQPAGFTLVELVAALALLGILAALAGPRFFALAGFGERWFHEDVRAALDHARSLAVATGCEVEWSISGGAYRLRQRASCSSGSFTQDVADPSTGQAPYTGAAPSGIAFASSVEPLRFDALGRARNSGGAVSDATVTVGARSVLVVGETGLVRLP